MELRYVHAAGGTIEVVTKKLHSSQQEDVLSVRAVYDPLGHKVGHHTSKLH